MGPRKQGGATAASPQTRVALVRALDVLMVRYGIDRERACALLSQVSIRSQVPIERLVPRVLGTASLDSVRQPIPESA